MDIIKTITDWPVIVQGALGSALFWAILEIGQRGIRVVVERFSSDNFSANWFALAAHEGPPKILDSARFFCFYGALHYLVKALIVVVLSWVVSLLLNVIASVGYLIAVYFLFRSLAFLPHTSSFGPISERKKLFEERTKHLLTQPNPGETSEKSTIKP